MIGFESMYASDKTLHKARTLFLFFGLRRKKIKNSEKFKK